jgi:hypothetical protein
LERSENSLDPGSETSNEIVQNSPGSQFIPQGSNLDWLLADKLIEANLTR